MKAVDKLSRERRISRVFVAPETISDWIQGAKYGHTTVGLPADAVLKNVFYDPLYAAYAFDYVSKHFEPVAGGAMPPTLQVTVYADRPISLRERLKLFFIGQGWL